MVKTYAQLYLDSRRELMQVEDIQSAGFMARSVICHFSCKSHEAFLADRELYVSQEMCQTVEAAVQRLLKQEPLAYVLGQWEFYGLPMQVDANVLIPRDDTCAVVSMAIRQAIFLNQNPRILDLCCGSGCIGLAIASRVRDSRVTLADISREALAVAKNNIALNKLTGRVSCIQANALEQPQAFLGKFDMIVSNPPYITAGEMAQLPPSVSDYEPHLALFGGEDGLDFYRAIAANYCAALKPGGYLCFEFGQGQGDDVARILEEHGYTILERTRDFNDIERAVLAQYGRKEDE